MDDDMLLSLIKKEMEKSEIERKKLQQQQQKLHQEKILINFQQRVKNAVKAVKNAKGKLGIGAASSGSFLAKLKATAALEKSQQNSNALPNKINSMPLERIEDEEEKQSARSSAKHRKQQATTQEQLQFMST